MTDKLKQARHYEQQQYTPAAQRPVFHATAPVGWCNDPNAFCWYGGQLHLFYQYHPYSTNWGPMHWGHAVTKDLLHWQHLPCALAPDTDADSDGCFSGGGIAWQGHHLLLYTGVSKDDAGNQIQQQCLALGDGRNYQKYEHNPVISCDQQPLGGSRADFRDPALFTHDGALYAVVGGRGQNGHGQILLYRAQTPQHWDFVSILAQNDGSLGDLWECPSLFTLQGRTILLVSPQYMRGSADGRYHPGNNAVALLGHWAGAEDVFHREADIPLDYGLDFYAPQTVLMPDGRRVMIGWLQNWDHCCPPPAAVWYGQMSVPRELFWQDGTLCQRPVQELDAARRLRTAHKGLHIGEAPQIVAGIKGRVLDLDLTVYTGQTGHFALRFGCGKDLYTELVFDLTAQTLCVDRRCCGGVHALLEKREAPLLPCPGTDSLRLRLLLDRFSAECFVQGGRQTVSLTMYDTPQSAEGITFYAKGGCVADVAAYDLQL